MHQETAQDDWQSKKVREWLLAVLRFAVTRDGADRATVFVLAQEMDRLDPGIRLPAFSYFIRTSAELCNAIAGTDNPHIASIFRRHLERIDDPRLRRALAAAAGIDQSPPSTIEGNPARKRDRKDLWKGLRR